MNGTELLAERIGRRTDTVGDLFARMIEALEGKFKSYRWFKTESGLSLNGEYFEDRSIHDIDTLYIHLRRRGWVVTKAEVKDTFIAAKGAISWLHYGSSGLPQWCGKPRADAS